MDSCSSQGGSNKGQFQLQPANEPKAEPVTSQPEPVKLERKAPAEQKLPTNFSNNAECPRCGCVGFFGGCHVCSFGAQIGL